MKTIAATANVNGNSQKVNFNIVEGEKLGVVRTFKLTLLSDILELAGQTTGVTSGREQSQNAIKDNTISIFGRKQLTKLNTHHLYAYPKGAEQTKSNRAIVTFDQFEIDQLLRAL